MTLPLTIATAASPFMWLPFVGYIVAVIAAIWALLRESAPGDVAAKEDHQSDE